MILEKYSMGIGDRFAHQGKAQLQALIMAEQIGVNVVPVWNKSHREHTIVNSTPEEVKREADAAAEELHWTLPYYTDADHINLDNVDLFLDSSDFFTVDVADFIGKAAEQEDIEAFVAKHAGYTGEMSLPGIDDTFQISEKNIEEIAGKYLLSIREAGKIYRHVEKARGKGEFITEISMDETDLPQTPLEMFFILAGLADEKIPVQTIAPKFTGRFNKGVEYAGDLNLFEKEFNQDLAVIQRAVKEFGLPENLKLSVHSGSDKFSIYEPISRAMKKYDAGLHLKTAGTTWLEELIGLAEAGGDGTEIAKEIYLKSLARREELAQPYATVIDININNLPSPKKIGDIDGARFAAMLRHDQSRREYNKDFRQLLHIGYKTAAEMEDRFLNALKRHEAVIAPNVTENILERHIKSLFPKS